MIQSTAHQLGVYELRDLCQFLICELFELLLVQFIGTSNCPGFCQIHIYILQIYFPV